jgi:hypothetical protein
MPGARRCAKNVLDSRHVTAMPTSRRPPKTKPDRCANSGRPDAKKSSARKSSAPRPTGICSAPGLVTGHWPNRSSIRPRTLPRSSLRFLALRRSWSAAAFSNAPRAAGLMPRKRASNLAASRPSPRTSRKRPASASPPVRRSAASRAATMSARVRFHGSRPDRPYSPNPNLRIILITRPRNPVARRALRSTNSPAATTRPRCAGSRVAPLASFEIRVGGV